MKNFVADFLMWGEHHVSMTVVLALCFFVLRSRSVDFPRSEIPLVFLEFQISAETQKFQ